MKNALAPGIPLAIRPPSTVEQVEYVFHELHPDGRNALCAVCDGQYRAGARNPPGGRAAPRAGTGSR
jgi:hypothetical protein